MLLSGSERNKKSNFTYCTNSFDQNPDKHVVGENLSQFSDSKKDVSDHDVFSLKYHKSDGEIKFILRSEVPSWNSGVTTVDHIRNLSEEQTNECVIPKNTSEIVKRKYFMNKEKILQSKNSVWNA